MTKALCTGIAALLSFIPMNKSTAATELFPLRNVRLLDGPFRQAERLNAEYLFSHDPDRLLAPARREAGLPPKADPYDNWESMGLDGHSAGHYLSALAQLFAATGDAEAKRRLDYMVDELAEIQRANGDGYVGGVPRSKEIWDAVRRAEFDASGFSLRGSWVPWYNLHKTFAGLRDAYLIAGSEKARDVLIGFADWADDVTGQLDDEQMQRMLRTEHGGMNEVLADVAAITGNDKYLRLAERFSHRALLDPLLQQRDTLTGLHANTQIPKVIGFDRIAQLSGRRDWHDAAVFFWNNVTTRRSVVIGGNSINEHFNPVDNFSDMFSGRGGPETCNTYNMLRLTELLFEDQPLSTYADFYERALLNHILSSQNPTTGGYVYYTPMRPGHYRTYSVARESFWCCVGTGFENHSKYGRFIYAHDGDTLYLNLFIASELNWESKGVRVRQETRFPDEATTRLTFSMAAPTAFALRIRHPEWVRQGELEVRVNGELQQPTPTESGYVELRRTWTSGDVVSLDLPMHLEAQRIPDGRDYLAFRFGPVVLASVTGTDDMDNLFARQGEHGGHNQFAAGPLVPLTEVPRLIVEPDAAVESMVQPAADAADSPLSFRIVAEVVPDSFKDIRLEPFFRIHEKRYVIYFPVSTRQQYEQMREAMAAEEERLMKLEAATVDFVAPGEQQSEVDHRFEGENSSAGIWQDRRFRHGEGWFSYRMKTPDEPAALVVTYYGRDRRNFGIRVDDQILADVRLPGDRGDLFFDVSYPLPANALGKTVTIRFQAEPNSLAGGIYGVRVVKSAP